MMPFGRHGFDGDYRSKPSQSFAGGSNRTQKDRLSLIQEAAQERKRREDMRRHAEFILKLQCEIRRYLAHRQATRVIRADFDTRFNDIVELSTNSVCNFCDSLPILVNQLGFFCDLSNPEKTSIDGDDEKRLLAFAEFLVVKSDTVLACVKDNRSLLNISLCKFFSNITSILASVKSYQIERFEPKLRQVFTLFSIYLNPANTTPEFYHLVWSILSKKFYFTKISSLFKSIIFDKAAFDVLISAPFFTFTGDRDNLRLRLRMFFKQFWTEFPNETVKERVLDSLCLRIAELGPNASNASVIFEAFEFDVASSSNSLAFISSFGAFLKILQATQHPLNVQEAEHFLRISEQFSSNLNRYIREHEQFKFQSKSDDDYDSDDEEEAMHTFNGTILKELDRIFQLYGSPQICECLTAYIDTHLNRGTLVAVSNICQNILLFNHSALSKNQFLHSLVFRRNFLTELWNFILTEPVDGKCTFLSVLTNYGDIAATQLDWGAFLPSMNVFCALYNYSLQTLDDVQFFKECTNEFALVQNGHSTSNYSIMAFKLEELVRMSNYLKDICIALLEFMFREMTETPSNRVLFATDVAPKRRDMFILQCWNLLKLYSFKLLSHLYARNIRKRFCPVNHWISSKVSFANFSPQELNVSNEFRNQVFSEVFTTNIINIQNVRLPMPIREIINLTIAQELPMVVPFEDRVRIFQSFVQHEKRTNDHDGFHSHNNPVVIRRSHIYEDSFEKLSKSNISNMKIRVRVQMQSQLGLAESGVDGGGVFREFLAEVLRAAFDPNRAFFKVTSDGLLYPNPNIHVLMENSGAHYYFIGRMLGKAIYENMLIDLPLAPFFLAKLLAKKLYSDVDINLLSSLDPELYRNLISLKNYKGDVAELNLDFTHVSSELGVSIVEDLKPGGANIAVTNANRIEYIHRTSDYKLNKQIRNQCAEFKKGFYDIVSFDWIRMFDTNEIQVIISGAQVPIDIDDLRHHTVYSNGYHPDHPVILLFWQVIAEFADDEKKKLLKFITSCARPPLLGFKDLNPKLCIQNSGSSDRLPTSSTCMNLLKLPEFNDKSTLKTRLLYSINSNSGFELS